MTDFLNPRHAALALTLGVATLAQAQVPNQMVMPTNGTGWTNTTGSPAHTSSGGIGGADDTQALDLNLPGDADFGKPVYATADGWIERNIGNGAWAGTSFGQLLLKHRNPDGSVYYCGYLHMSGITALKATQGAYVQAGTVLGTVNHVATTSLPNHLHMACYTWNGTKLVSQAMTLNTNLQQVSARPSFSTVGSVSINGKVVNVSPYPVTRFTPFSLVASLKNLSGYAKSTRFRLVLTRDQAGSDYVGLVAPLASVACSSLNDQASVLQTFNNPGFSSPAGNYWLQIYFDDCSSPFAALKRVAGSPIAIKLQ